MDIKEFSKRFNAKKTMVLGELYKRFISQYQNDIYKEDSSNKWILSIGDLERIIDFSGFKIITEIKNPYASRITCICKKKKPFPTNYADRGIYKTIKKRISNVDNFLASRKKISVSFFLFHDLLPQHEVDQHWADLLL